MKIGLALSGGGARGIFHIGVLQALKDNNIHVDVISGTSAGALIGAFYAAGIPPEEILHLANKTSWFNFISPEFPTKGLTSHNYIKSILEKYIPKGRFENLHIPLTVTATNMNKGTLDLFSKGELYSAVLASCSVPLLFKPITINNQTYLDGGILMNLPAKPIRSKCDFLIGSNLIPNANIENEKLNGYTPLMTRVLELSIINNSVKQKALCDLLIETEELSTISKFDFKESNRMFQMAYDRSEALIKESMLKRHQINLTPYTNHHFHQS